MAETETETVRLGTGGLAHAFAWSAAVATGRAEHATVLEGDRAGAVE